MRLTVHTNVPRCTQTRAVVVDKKGVPVTDENSRLAIFPLEATSHDPDTHVPHASIDPNHPCRTLTAELSFSAATPSNETLFVVLERQRRRRKNPSRGTGSSSRSSWSSSDVEEGGGAGGGGGAGAGVGAGAASGGSDPQLWIPMDHDPFPLTPEVRQSGEHTVLWDYMLPLRNETPMTRWEMVKIFLMSITLIPLLRLVLVTVATLFAIAWLRMISCFTCRSVDAANAAPPHIRLLLWPVHVTSRFILLCLGFFYINEDVRIPNINFFQRTAILTGVGTPRIIICNHHGWIEHLYWVSRCMFSFVGRRDLKDTWVLGPALSVFSPILVDREDPDSRQHALAEMKVRAKALTQDTPNLVVYPMGSVSNQRFLLKFRRGAFTAGQPVLPVYIRYPFYNFDLTWELQPLFALWRTCCQVYNRMEVVYLPPYIPSEPELANPELFADNVRHRMIQDMKDMKQHDVRASHVDVQDILKYFQQRDYGINRDLAE